MANKRIKDISTTATSAASDDFVVIDGVTNGTRKIDARPLGGVFDENITTTGQIQVAGGAVASPSYAFVGDVDSGISRPTSDAVNIVTGGAERLRITNDGLVINASSADAKLHVVGSAASGGTFKFVDGSARTLQDLSGGALSWSAASVIGGTSWAGTADHEIKTLTTARDTLLVTGPASGSEYGLHVTGLQSLFDGKVGIGGSPSNAYSEGDDLVIGDATDTFEGISLLTSTSGKGAIYFGDGTSGADRYKGFVRYLHSSDSLELATGGLSRLTVNSSGNLLVGGTTGSGDRLEVFGSDNLFAARLNGGTTGSQSYGLRIRAGTNSVDQSLLIENSSGTDMFVVKGDGTVKISGATHPTLNLVPATNSGDSIIQFRNTADDGTVATIKAMQTGGTIDRLALGCGGSEHLVISAAGNIGISTSSPGSYHSNANNLVVGSGIGDEGLTIASGSSSGGSIYFADGTAGDQAYRGIVSYSHNTDALSIATAGANRLTVDSSGNLGIGVSTVPHKLFVQPADGVNFSISNNGSALRLNAVNNDATANVAAEFTASSYNFIGGNLGVGGSPDVKFHINEAAGLSKMRLQGGAAGADTFDIMQGVTGVTNGGLSIYDVNETATRLIIDSSGRVGIGTASIANKLTVEPADNDGILIDSNNDSRTGYLYFGDATSKTVGAISYDHSTDALRFNTGGSERMRIVGGNLGVGISAPDKTLTVKAGVINTTIARFTGANDDRGLVLGTAPSGITNDAVVVYDAVSASTEGTHAWKTDGTERIRLNSSGLGLGTSSPSAPLSVENSSNPKVTFGYGGSNAEHQLAWDSSKFNISADAGDAVANSEIGFYVDGTSRATIDGSGNLTVNGGVVSIENSSDAVLSLNCTASKHYKIYSDASGNLNFRDQGGAVTRANLDTDGNFRVNGGRFEARPTTGTNTGSQGEIRLFGHESNASRFAAIKCMNTGGTDQNALSFYTSSGGTETQRVRIDEVAGDVEVLTGNVVIGTSGKGIDFSANSHAAGMTLETIDSYEEGSWDPVYETPGTAYDSITNVKQNAYYVKVGAKVFISGYINTSALTHGSASGNLRIAGLPFAVSGNSSMSVGFGAGFNANGLPELGEISTDGKIYLNRSGSAGTTALAFNALQPASGTYNRLIFSGSYYTTA